MSAAASESDMVTLTARCAPWTAWRRGEYRVRVDLADESVTVWDSVAGHYTTCHALRAPAVRRIVRLARRLAEVAR